MRGHVNGVEHRLAEPYGSCTSGQAEKTVRTPKESTASAYHHETCRRLSRHVADYLTACNFDKHLKALGWKTPYETIHALWESRPALFCGSPGYPIPGPSI